MAKPDIWMPLYVNDYLGDTMHLTRDEHGGYMLLIMAYWKRGGPLPDDATSLAAICRATLDEWQRALNARLIPFFQVHGGYWHHKRVDEEIIKAKANIDQKRRAGEASANARRNARSTDVITHVPTALPTEAQRNGNASPSPSPIQKHTNMGPILSEVQDEGGLTGVTVYECQRFHDYHTAHGWNRLADWRAALRLWKPEKTNGSKPPLSPKMKRGGAFSALYEQENK